MKTGSMLNNTGSNHYPPLKDGCGSSIIIKTIYTGACRYTLIDLAASQATAGYPYFKADFRPLKPGYLSEIGRKNCIVAF